MGSPLADLAGLAPLAIPDKPLLHGLGIAIAALGIVLVLAAQLSLGAARPKWFVALGHVRYSH